MKKLSILFLVTLFSLLSFARQLTPAEAMARMKGDVTTSRRVKARQQSSHLVYTAEQQGLNLFYVVNHGTDGGFTILGADDLAPAVLGYTDCGQFDYNTVPVQLHSMLLSYEQEILSAIKSRKTILYATVQHNPVDFMVTSQWNQGAPYNLLCTDMGYQSYTGCVATAMAQIMYYHRWPETGVGQRTYTFQDKTIFSRFADHTYNWSVMRDTYTKTDTDDGAQAVALLMHDCGVSIDMQYTRDAAGAADVSVPNALSTYFGYSKGIRIKYRAFFPTADWEQMILDELDAQRPVLYCGITSKQEGHAFVVDGYDGNGYYHINWGWGGSYNGNFLLTGRDALNPYGTGIGGGTTGEAFTLQNSIIIGIQKSDGTGTTEPYLCSYDGITAELVDVLSESDEISFDISVINFGTASLTTRPLLGLQSQCEGASATNYSITELPILQVGVGGTISYNLQVSSLQDGIYTFHPVTASSTSKRKTWKDIPLPYGYVNPKVEIKNGHATLIEAGGVPETTDDEDEDDAIHAVYATQQTTTWKGVYNLQGQPVSQPTHGLYIRDGKKILVK